MALATDLHNMLQDPISKFSDNRLHVTMGMHRFGW